MSSCCWVRLAASSNASVSSSSAAPSSFSSSSHNSKLFETSAEATLTPQMPSAKVKRKTAMGANGRISGLTSAIAYVSLLIFFGFYFRFHPNIAPISLKTQVLAGAALSSRDQFVYNSVRFVDHDLLVPTCPFKGHCFHHRSLARAAVSESDVRYSTSKRTLPRLFKPSSSLQ